MNNRAFTLVEMMVAVSIFSIVMLVGIGALLTMIEVNRRAQAVASIMNNLNAAVEEMSRTARTGTMYRCLGSGTGGGTYPDIATIDTSIDYSGWDCANEFGVGLAFESANGDQTDYLDQTVYYFYPNTSGTDGKGRIMRRKDSNVVKITSEEVDIQSVKFYVKGSKPLSDVSSDARQARVVITIEGQINIKGSVTKFNIESAVTQRVLDL